MKKEEIIVSFETAKKLKEAGRNKECVFKYEHYTGDVWDSIQGQKGAVEIIISKRHIKESGTELYQAPTSEEIIEELPDDVEPIKLNKNEKSLVEASAKMWLRLKENKHI